MSLDGLVVVVVGTSPNIGAGLAVGAAEAGATVVCVDRDEDHADACAAEAAAVGTTAVAKVADACDSETVERCVSEVITAFGRIDGLVNAAAYYDERGLLEMPVDGWRQQIDTILTSAFLFSKHVASAMIEREVRGSIVNLASTAAHQGQPGNIAYTTAKAAILNFTRAAAMDLASHRIRVNSMTPTSTDPAEAHARATSWGVDARPYEPTRRQRHRRSLIPFGTMPTPSDYSVAVNFLLSPAADAITGIDLRVDSGAVAKYWAAVEEPRPVGGR